MLTGKFTIVCRDSGEKLAELTAEKRSELQKQENARCVFIVQLSVRVACGVCIYCTMSKCIFKFGRGKLG